MTIWQLLSDMDIIADKPNAAELARVIGCHRSYMHRVLAGTRGLSVARAVKIYREKSVKIGPITQLTDTEIQALEDMGGRLEA